MCTVNYLANTTRASYSYDNASRLTRLANINSSSTTLSSFSYKYDNAGNRTRVLEASGNIVSWTYDPTYQLTRELRSGANSYANTYTYDPVGNRLVLKSGGVPTTSTYDAANRLIGHRPPEGSRRTCSTGPGTKWACAARRAANDARLGRREPADLVQQRLADDVRLQRRQPTCAPLGPDQRDDDLRVGRRDGAR